MEKLDLHGLLTVARFLGVIPLLHGKIPHRKEVVQAAIEDQLRSA